MQLQEISTEQRRQERLQDLKILDTPLDSRFERIVELATQFFPGLQCAIVFVDHDRVWAKATEKGVQMSYSRDESFCGTAVQLGEQLQLEDALSEARFKELEAVRKAGIRFYANRLLRTLDGTVVGSLCLRATEPRRLSEDDVLNLDLLGVMANELVAQIEGGGSEVKLPSQQSCCLSSDSRFPFDEVFDESPLAMGLLTWPDLECADLNHAALALLGQSKSMLAGRTLDNWAGESSSVLVRHFKAQLRLRQRTTPFEFTFKAGNGENRIVSIVGQTVSRGRDVGVLVFYQDVTRARLRDQRMRWLFEGTSAHTGADFLRKCSKSVVRMTGAHAVVISRRLSGNQVRLLCFWNEGSFMPNDEMDVSGAPCERVLNGENVFISDNLATATSFKLYQEMGMRSFTGVPIRGAAQEVIGHLAIMAKSPMQPDPDREPMLTAISARVASEILRADAETLSRDDLRRAKLLQRISREIRKSLDPAKILRTAAEEIGVAFRVSRCLIHIVESGWKGEPLPVSAEYLASGVGPMSPSSLNVGPDSPFSKVITDDATVAIDDISKEAPSVQAAELLEANNVVSVAAVRITNRTAASGIIILQQCGELRTWRRQDTDLLQAIADQLGIGLAHASALTSERKRSEELRDAQAKAEAASRAKGDFLARMSHELRTPLNSILGFSKLLESDSELTENHLETLRIINRSGEHLLSLISDVLEMSKIEAGQTDVALAPMNLPEMIETVEKMFQFRAESNELDFLVDCSPELPEWISSDLQKLRQVLANLLGNAFKFTRKGSVSLTVEQTGDELRFTVSDTGCGIEPEEMPKLFKVFSQTQEGRCSTEGSGLGLAISKGFVELLGGEIGVSSLPGKGAAFRFSVPLSISKAPDQAKKPLTSHSVVGIANGLSPKLLIVDDQFENRLFLKRFLSKMGFSIVEAVDGQHAIEVVNLENPDGILMDIRMPVMDGITATRELRSSGITMPIIALTGNAFEEDRLCALESGCCEFLSKPVDFDALLRALRDRLKIEFVTKPAVAV